MPVKVLLLFVDGVGLAAADEENNPLTMVGPGFGAFSGGRAWTSGTGRITEPARFFSGIDACLGLPGLPQSGTGQSTLFTGVNCAALAGRHYGPLPHSTARPLLATGSLFSAVTRRFGAGSAVFANGFPPQFFEAVSRRDRWPTISRACRDAGVLLRSLDDIRMDEAVAADITGRGLSRYTEGSVVPRTPEAAAHVLTHLAEQARFTVFEVFHTDKAGHDQSHERARQILDDLDALIQALIRDRPDELTIVVTSDHGNVEDLSVRTHTRNPVPLAAIGPGARHLASVTDLTGIAPALLELLGGA